MMGTMIRPAPLALEQPHGPWSCRGCDIWDTLSAARDGDVAALRALLEQDPNLYRAEYWYTQPIHFAVREGHVGALRVLLDAGADPAWVGLEREDLATVARDRGHTEVAQLLETRRSRPSRVEPAGSPAVESPIHAAAESGDVERVRALLDADQELVQASDGDGRSPLSRAATTSSREVVALLLERGADPNWSDDPGAPRGAALHTASRAGDVALVELLLAHGADPDATIDSAGSATYAAATPELRALLVANGGRLNPYDLVWLGEHDEVLRRVTADPESAHEGCGGVLAAACTLGKRDLVVRLLEAGVRVPPVLTECRSYLWGDPDLLRLLLDSGMDPDLPDWQCATPLHSLCQCDRRGRPRPHHIECADMFLEAGATLSARDSEYRSTPLGWAARNGLADMVVWLLERGAPVELADDEPWATPLAWATRRGHPEIAERLEAGAQPTP